MHCYIIPTPIGNIKDITLRALEILKSVDFILCEDTRTSGVLLKHYDIQKPLIAYHQHNEHLVYKKIIEDVINKNLSIGLITDAGTPGISDPAFLLIRECIKCNIQVECLPGATAFVPALIASGLPSNKFVFEGFLPLKKDDILYYNNYPKKNEQLYFMNLPSALLKH